MPILTTPLRSNVLLRLQPVAAKSGLIHRVSHYEATRKADVLAVGPECRDVAAGQVVLVNPLIGQQVGDDELLQPESSILAFVE